MQLPLHTKLVIFDMDGLLIDSEPYWKQAEKLVFGKLGLQLTDDLLKQVMGFRLTEVVKYWYDYQPWPNPDLAKTEAEILHTVTHLIDTNAQAMPGVYQVLKTCKQQGFQMAVASSSNMALIEVVVNKLNIAHYFDLLWSAQYEAYGKPHPAIFLSVANKLNVTHSQCVVFEDSLNGIIAAKAAKMYCIAVPDKTELTNPKYQLADVVIPSLEAIR